MRTIIDVVHLKAGHVGQVYDVTTGDVIWESEPLKDLTDADGLVVSLGRTRARDAAQQKVAQVLADLFADKPPGTVTRLVA